MALHFGLEVECGAEASAKAVAAHFEGLPLQLSDGLVFHCEAHTWRDTEGNWWCGASPPGACLGLPGRDNPLLQDARRLTEIGHLLYERLRSAPEFRYALAGIETSDFRQFSELDEDLVTLNFQGVVIQVGIWRDLGSPPIFVPFRDGYLWRPYVGEERGL
jgi:hypothetical protein